MSYASLYTLFCSHTTIIYLLSALQFAVIGTILRNSVAEISLFMGPKLVTFRIHDIDYSIRLFPLGSYVKFNNSIAEFPSYIQIVFFMLNPIGMILISIIAIGVVDTINLVIKFLQILFSIFSWVPSIRSLFVDPFNALTTCSFQQGIAYTAIWLAIMEILPLPGTALGRSIIATLDPIHSLSLKSRERLLLIDFLFRIIIILIFAYYFISHPFV